MTKEDHDKRVLLLDFDGTVCVGDGPVWAYAEAVIAGLLEAPDTTVDTSIRSQLGAFLDGAPGSGKYLDGYAAVAELAAGHADSAQLEQAYQASRRALSEGSIAVSTPPGLADFLEEIGDQVRRVLVTNAPEHGIGATLSSLGLRNRIDEIITDAAKPSGWQQILPTLLASRPASHVMSVGDIWRNDLQEPLAAGCCTALIDRFGHRAGAANVTAERFENLFPALRDWAEDPEAFAASNPAVVAGPVDPGAPAHPADRPDSPSSPPLTRTGSR